MKLYFSQKQPNTIGKSEDDSIDIWAPLKPTGSIVKRAEFQSLTLEMINPEVELRSYSVLILEWSLLVLLDLIRTY